MKWALRAVYYGIRSKINTSFYEYDPGQFSGWAGMRHNAGIWHDTLKTHRQRRQKHVREKMLNVPSIHIRIFNIHL